MKEFMKDYKGMCIDPQFDFIAKHWKGYVLLNIGAVAVMILSNPIMKEYVSDTIKSKFNKKEKEL